MDCDWTIKTLVLPGANAQFLRVRHGGERGLARR